jgi:hypothetical protein
MRKAAPLFLLCASFVILARADAGHELPYYPSYYPQEIRIESLGPAAAAALLPKGALHAYVGGEPAFGAKVPEGVAFVTSLGSYLVLTFNPLSPTAAAEESRCAAAGDMLRSLAGPQADFRFHPYPVTPFHMDYLHHADLAEAARQRILGGHAGRPGTAAPGLRVRAEGPLAERLVRPRWPMVMEAWDVTVEEIDVGHLILSQSVSLNGWLGPPWIKAGWFHAYLILAGMLGEPAAREAVDALARRLFQGAYGGLEEKLNLERQLVSRLSAACNRAVVGFTLRREYFNTGFSEGIENISYDSHTGFTAPIFLRTVKLKDFPWNGWLRLGINGMPSAAWNPIGGFTDPAGRLLWYAVGDPAFFPEPYDGSQTVNRMADFQFGPR